MADAHRPLIPLKPHIIAPRPRIILRVRQGRPFSGDRPRCPGAKIARPVGADGFHEKQVEGRRGVVDEVDAGGFVKGVDSHICCFGDDRVGHEMGEVVNTGLAPIQMTIIVARKQVACCSVADRPHVDPVPAAYVVGDEVGLVSVEGGRCGPPGNVADVWVGGVCCVAVLVDQVPELLRLKEEDFRGGAVAGADGGLVEVVKCLVED